MPIAKVVEISSAGSTYAGVVKLVDTCGLGPHAARRGGSSPLPGT